MKCSDCHTELTEETKGTLWLDVGKPFHLDRFCRLALVVRNAELTGMLKEALTRLEYWIR